MSSKTYIQNMLSKYCEVAALDLLKEGMQEKDVKSRMDIVALDFLNVCSNSLKTLSDKKTEEVIKKAIHAEAYDVLQMYKNPDVKVLLETINESMEKMMMHKEKESTELNYRAYDSLKQLIEKHQVRSIMELECLGNHRYDVVNWMSDLDMMLLNARNYDMLQEIVSYFLSHLDFDSNTRSNFERAYAEAYERRGDHEACDSYFNEKLSEHPDEHNLYFGWALIQEERKNYAEAIDLIEKGLALNSVYQEMFLEQADRIYEITGEENKFSNYSRKKTKSIRVPMSKSMKSVLPLEIEAYENAKPNKPCPCGSGKKFKACCAKVMEKA